MVTAQSPAFDNQIHQIEGASKLQAFLVTSGGCAVKSKTHTTGNYTTIRLQSRETIVLTGGDVIKLPCDEDIADKSKADSVAKCITLLQVLWFTTQLIGRAAERLRTTTLELLPLGFIVCTTVTYISWWHKPKDIGRAILCERLTPRQESELFIGGTENHVSLLDALSTLENEIVFATIASVVTLAFAAAHLSAWDFHFPTETERMLWRVAGVLCGLLPFIFILVLGFWDTVPEGRGWKAYEVICWLIGVIYILVRCYLLVEVFVSLRSVPEGVYKTVRWSSYLPHI